MSRKTKNTLIFIGSFLGILALVGLTYAFFSTRFVTNTNQYSIQVSTKNLTLAYNDTADIISGTNLKPNTIIGTKSFSVTNNGDYNSYSVIVDNVSITNLKTGVATTFNSNDFRYTLTCSSTDGTNCMGVTDGVLPLENNAILISNNINHGARHDYTITITYIETGVNQGSDMNKKLVERLNIKAADEVWDPNYNPYASNTNLLSYHIINNAINNANGTVLTNTPLTTPGYQVSLYNSVFYSFGDTYYDLCLSQNDNENYICDTYSDRYFVFDSSLNENNSSDLEQIYQTQMSRYSCTQDMIGKKVYMASIVCSDENYDEYGEKCVINEDVAPPSIVEGCDINGEFIVNITGEEENIIPTEKELIPIEDNYTNPNGNKSYYFRGGVEDNYVNFAGKCWRIVRIEGDGSVKLILASKNGVCNANGALTSNSAIISTDLDTWYSQNLNANSVNSKIKEDTIYINDGKQYNKYCLEDVLGESSSNGTCSMWDYDTDLSIRLAGGSVVMDDFDDYLTNINPRLTIPTNSEVKNLHVHELTPDEAVLAGMVYENESYTYLNDNSDDTMFYLSSYLCKECTAIVVDNVNYKGLLYMTDSEAYYRPTITLKNTTTISSGNGTKTSPYVIN